MVSDASHRHNPRNRKDYKRYRLANSTRRFAYGRLHILYGKNFAPMKPSAERAVIMTERHDTLRFLAPNINRPALVIHGRDSMSQSLKNLKKLRSQLPNGKLVQIADASHYVQEDQPRALLTAIRDFLKDVPY